MCKNCKTPYYITTAIAYTSGKPHIGNLSLIHISKDSYNAKDFEEDFSLGGTIRGNSVKLSVLVGKVDGQWGILGGLMY